MVMLVYNRKYLILKYDVIWSLYSSGELWKVIIIIVVWMISWKFWGTNYLQWSNNYSLHVMVANDNVMD